MLIRFTKLNIGKILTLFFLLVLFSSLWATEIEVQNNNKDQFGIYQSNSIIDRSQFVIAKALRTYLRSDMSQIEKRKKQHFINRLYDGYCIGLTTLWLYSRCLLVQSPELVNMSILENPFARTKNEKWFWSVIELILNWDGKRKLNCEETADIDNFIEMVDFFQCTEKYNINPGDLNIAININQRYPIKKEYAIGSLFTLEEFKDLLKVEDFIRDGRLVFITSHNHASGLFKLNDYYYYYNANSPSGEYVTKSLDDLAVIIFAANEFEKNIPSPIGIRIFYFDQETKPYPSPKELLKQVIHNFAPKPGYANSYSMLTIAAEVGSVESIQFLLSLEQIDPNAVNDIFNTALMIASSYGYVDIVKTLMEDKRVDVNVANKWGHTALILAVFFNHSDVVKVLLEDKYHRVNINAVDKLGWTALKYAKHYNRQDIVEMLLSYNS